MSDVTVHSVELVVPADADLEQAGETVPIDVREDESVLAAARAADVWLAADCQQGWCTTCAGEVLDGEVEHSAAKRYYDSDREANLALLCVARPLSDLRVRVAQQELMLDVRAANSLPPGDAKR